MALGIYKPGQGYWVRVMTATLIGLATLAVAGWGWGQTKALVSQLPKVGYALNFKTITADVAGGTNVALLGPADAEGKQEEIGTATLVTPIKTGGINQPGEIRSMAMKEGKDASATTALRDITSGAKVAEIASKNPIAPIEEALASTIIASVVIVFGTILAYWLVAMRTGTVDFLIATDFEMKRVNWSTRREVYGSTIVVIATCLILAATLFFFDFSMKQFFQTINLLQF